MVSYKKAVGSKTPPAAQRSVEHAYIIADVKIINPCVGGNHSNTNTRVMPYGRDLRHNSQLPPQK